MSSNNIEEDLTETCVENSSPIEIEIVEMVLDHDEPQFYVLENAKASFGSPAYEISQDISNNRNSDNQMNLHDTISTLGADSINEEVIVNESDVNLNFENSSNAESVVVAHINFLPADKSQYIVNHVSLQNTDGFSHEKPIFHCGDVKKAESTVNANSRYAGLTKGNHYHLAPHVSSSSSKLLTASALPENVEISENFYNQIIQSLAMKKEISSLSNNPMQSFSLFNDTSTYNNSVKGEGIDDYNEELNEEILCKKSFGNGSNVNFTLNRKCEYDDEEGGEDEEEGGEDINDKGSNVITYTILPSCSTRGRDLLVDSRGYSYANKPTSSKKVGAASYWRCVRRSKKTYCHASVIEKHGLYRPGKHPHSHPPRTGELLKRRIYAEAKFLKSTNTEVSLSDVIEVIASETPETEMTHLNNTAFYKNVSRAVSRRKSSNLFQPIKDLNFDLEMDRVPPDFLIGDLFVHERRHLIFASERMIGLLSKAKTWYIDECEEICRSPFKQLMIIHTNIKRNQNVKQVPVLFALMSGRKRKDYTRILNLVKNIMPENIKLHRIVSDFQKNLWKAVEVVFPQVAQRGCLYHWTMSLWRQLQSFGLQEIYIKNDMIHNFCRQLMALPFIPAQEVQVQFQILTEKVPDDFLALHSFIEYIRNCWIENPEWPVETWNVFLQPIQASNDCGGLHDRLNIASRSAAPFLYRLINLLHIEAEYIDTDVKVFEEKKNTLIHNNIQGLNSRLNTIWADYMGGLKSCRKLLKSCARIHGPELYCY